MKKLLIVDDDVPLLDSLRFVFRGLYDVLATTTAEQAAAMLERETVDVLLLDIHLPGMDGVEFLHRIRRQRPFLPIVMISAASSIKPILRVLELEGAEYVRKPFDIDELRLVVARALRLGDLRRRVAELEQAQVPRPAPDAAGAKPMKRAVEDFERTLIQKALQRANGVQTRAAQMLGTTRRILRYRMEKLSIPSAEP